MIRKNRTLLLAGLALALLLAAGAYFLIRFGAGAGGSASAEGLPAVVVEASYPGANAQVVAETVGMPIEQQVNGVEGMVHMSSRSTNDGSYTLTVTFEPGTDLNIAQVLVQNREALAERMLPEMVKRAGVKALKRAPGVLLIVTLSSPDRRYDEIYMSNYAKMNIKDELERLTGVWGVSLIGPHDTAVRVWIDPDKLAALNLTADNVVRAIRENHVDAVGQGGVKAQKGIPVALNGLGRLAVPEDLGNLVVKQTPDGRSVRLR